MVETDTLEEGIVKVVCGCGFGLSTRTRTQRPLERARVDWTFGPGAWGVGNLLLSFPWEHWLGQFKVGRPPSCLGVLESLPSRRFGYGRMGSAAHGKRNGRGAGGGSGEILVGRATVGDMQRLCGTCLGYFAGPVSTR